MQGQGNRFSAVRAVKLFSPHTVATTPAGSPGSAGVTVESATSEPSTDVAGNPSEEQTTRYVDKDLFQQCTVSLGTKTVNCFRKFVIKFNKRLITKLDI